MAGPNYLSSVVRRAVIALRILRTVCLLAHRIDDHIQGSAYQAEVRTASTAWLAACETFCAVVEAAYDALPDGG